MVNLFSTKVPKWDFPGGPVAQTLYSQCRAPSLIPGQGTRSHMPQLRVHMTQLKILHVARKTEDLECHN